MVTKSEAYSPGGGYHSSAVVTPHWCAVTIFDVWRCTVTIPGSDVQYFGYLLLALAAFLLCRSLIAKRESERLEDKQQDFVTEQGTYWLLEGSRRTSRLKTQAHVALGAILLFIGLDLIWLGSYPYIGLASLTIDNPPFVVSALVLSFLLSFWTLCNTWKTTDVQRTLGYSLAAISFMLMIWSIKAHIDPVHRGGFLFSFIVWCVAMVPLITFFVRQPSMRRQRPAVSR